MKILFYGNCQIRVLKRIFEFITEPFNHSLLIFKDIDQLDDSEMTLTRKIASDVDVVISTRVTDFKSELYHSHSLFACAPSSARCIEIPSLYFSGLSPNVGELYYPDSTSKGYEDIWLYNFFLENISNISNSIWIKEIHTSLSRNIYHFEGEIKNSTFLNYAEQFFNISLEASYSRLMPADNANSNLNKDCIVLSPVNFIKQNITNKFPLFFTPNHPHPSLVYDLVVQICNLLSIQYSEERAQFLISSNFSNLDISSIDFIKFNLPSLYAKFFNIPSDNFKYIDYRPRYSIDDYDYVSLENYINQLAARMIKDTDVTSRNQSLIKHYKEQHRILELSNFL
jgi:hypothetical protein